MFLQERMSSVCCELYYRVVVTLSEAQ